MSRCFVRAVVTLLVLTSTVGTARAIDFFFVPDTVAGAVGDTVTFSGRIGASDLMRGFTVYLAYDTSVIDLAPPPLPGSLIAGLTGMQFNYFDYSPFQPDRLEIGATVFGSSFWQGPGELFTMRMALRSCGSELLAAPYAPFFVAADGSFPAVTFHPALVRICAAVPQPAGALTIALVDPLSVLLRWLPVTQDTSGFPLPAPPIYTVMRRQVLPALEPAQSIATTPDTSVLSPLGPGVEYIYYIITATAP